jgi:RecG-like helicase
MRGPGDLEGTAQSGIAFDLRVANLSKDSAILETARETANQILQADPHLENASNALLRKTLETIKITERR